MAALDFPSSPTLNQIYTANGRTWLWDGSSWVSVPALDVAGFAYKQSVRAATTANITLSGTQTIDGISVVAGDRVLVKNQTSASANGIYVVAAGAWTRATDADTAAKIGAAIVNVSAGTANGGELWTTTFKTTDTLNTTSMNWFEVVYNSGTWAINVSGSAATLTTARTINGTNFNGSANITTASWGTARTLTIGSTGKSVDGSANVSWSLAEIGAAGLNSPSFTGTPLTGGFEIGYRKVPLTSVSTVTADATIVGRGYLATSTVTVPANVFVAGDIFSVINNSAANISIVQGSGLTMRLVNTATTGTRTLAQRGIATIMFVSATECIVTGVT